METVANEEGYGEQVMEVKPETDEGGEGITPVVGKTLFKTFNKLNVHTLCIVKVITIFLFLLIHILTIAFSAM